MMRFYCIIGIHEYNKISDRCMKCKHCGIIKLIGFFLGIRINWWDRR